MRHLIPRKFSWQLMTVFAVFAIVPFVIMSWLSLDRMSQALEKETKTRVTQMIHLGGTNLDARFQTLSNTTEKMYLYHVSINGTSSDLETILKSHRNAQFEMSNYVGNLLDSNDFLRNVLFVDCWNQHTYAAGKPAYKNLKPSWDAQTWPFLQEASLHPRQMSISEPHVEEYFNFGSRTVFTFCRPYLSLQDLPEKETILGYLLLDIDESIFDDAFSAYDWSENGTLYVLDDRNAVRYASRAEEIGTVITFPENSRFTLLTEDMPSCGWRVVFLLDRMLSMQNVRQLRHQLILLGAFLLLMMLVLTWLSSRHLSRPIQTMLQQMNKVQAGDLTARVPVQGNDEISALSLGFNHMVSALDTHIQKSYVASIRQKEAELDALRMQIHPHFLYNTLEVIRMSSVGHNDPETAQMTLSLVRQLQYVIGESKEQVPLGKELDIVRDYIALVSLRYGQIDLTTDIPAMLSNCPILKMTLQPIVENAVQHGLRPLGGGQISISAAREGDTLRLTVMDNGCGMSAEQLNALRAQLESDHLPAMKEDGLRSIGTKNVHDRIRLACGHPYGLEIESQEDVGTAVVIRLPYQQPEGLHETIDC
jgi:two-component system sensor histidine kinase YesM